MVQVTMTGPEYAELLEKERRLSDLMALYRKDRGFSVPKDSISTYSSGVFMDTFEFPTWLQYFLLKDMEEQLLLMPDEEFARLVKAEHYYYNPQEKSFRAELYSSSRGYTNMREFSKRIAQRWETIQQTLDKGESFREEEQDNG